MSTNHEKILDLVRGGRLHITFIAGTRRSGSTIATRAFAELSDVALGSLFSRLAKAANPSGPSLEIENEGIYEAFCRSILDSLSDKSKKGPVNVVVKGTSGRMAPSLFRQWVQLPSSFLVTFRDPATQFVSLARAFYGRDILKTATPPEIAEFVATILPRIEHAPYPRFGKDLINTNRKFWEAMCAEIEMIREACLAQRQCVGKAVFLDTNLMRFDPETAWLSVFQGLGLDAAGVDRLLNNEWTNGVTGQQKEISAFKARAYNSTGIQPLNDREKVVLENLPERSREHVQQLLSIYERLLRAPENAYLPGPYEVENRFCHGTQTTLASLNPIAVQAVTQIYSARKSSFCPDPLARGIAEAIL